MRAAVHRRHGGPEVIEITDVPDPVLGPKDALVAVRTAALNRLDVLQRRGPGLLPGFALPHIAGMDLAGHVVAVGDPEARHLLDSRVVVNPALTCGTCTACRAGDDAFCSAGAVVGGNRAGGFAELCAVPITNVHPIPDDVSYDHAAALPTALSTAWRAVLAVGAVQPGETVLINAAASGVSTVAIQLAVRAGARVIASASTEEKLATARALGASAGVVNRAPDWVDQVLTATDGRGVDMVFDHVGPALFQGSLDTLRPRGRMVFCGTTSGVEACFQLPSVYQRGLRLIGVESYSRAEFTKMLDEAWASRLVTVVDSLFPLDELAAAHERLESGAVAGKVLIHPQQGD